jgi:purine-binding chemotaxis protein CheW
MSAHRRRPGPPAAAAGTGGGEAADSANESTDRRTAAGGAGTDIAKMAAAGPLTLPESGTAEEILAQLGMAADPQSGAAGQPAVPRERVYSFADSLDRRGEEAQEPREQPASWVVFELAGERYGLPVAAVQEILRVGTITRVPHTPSPVRGITNRRGRVLAVVDLRVRLGLPAAALEPRSRILVVDSRRRTLGLLVDAALQVVKLLPSALEAPPADVMTERSDYILGVYHVAELLIITLDLDRVLLIHDESAPRHAAAGASPPPPGPPGGP